MKKSFKIATSTLLLTGIGTSVVVPPAALAQTPSTWTQRSVEEISQETTQQENDVRYYKVQWGDTLSGIAQALGMELEELVRINNISNPDFILAGTILVFDAANHTLTEIDEAGNSAVYSTQTGEAVVEATPAYETIEEVQEETFVPEVALSLPVVEEEVTQEEPTTIIEEVEEFETTFEPVQEEVSDVVVNDDMTEEVEEIVIEDTPVQEEIVEESIVEETVEVIENTVEETETDIEETVEENETDIEEMVQDEVPSLEVEEVTVSEVEPEVAPEPEVQPEVIEEVQPEVVEPEEAPTPSVDTSNMSAREAFDSLAAEKGLSQAEIEGWAYIIERESNWDPQATNASSGAYGLAQNIDPSRYASHGDDWATNPNTQLEWMYDYMSERYGSIHGALDFWNANHWY